MSADYECYGGVDIRPLYSGLYANKSYTITNNSGIYSVDFTKNDPTPPATTDTWTFSSVSKTASGYEFSGITTGDASTLTGCFGYGTGPYIWDPADKTANWRIGSPTGALTTWIPGSNPHL